MAGKNPPPAKVNFGQVGLEFSDLRPEGGATVILADPPWRFGTWSQKGVTKKGAGGQYDCMALEDIMRLPVATLAAPDCCLWLWATNPMLPQALMVMSAWGFEFKTAGTWVKRSKLGKMLMGTGYVLRSCNEPFLLGVRGKPKVARPGWGALLDPLDGDDMAELEVTLQARRREHSRKPDACFDAIDGMFPDSFGRRVELFSREPRDGWRAWGNQTDKFPPPSGDFFQEAAE